MPGSEEGERPRDGISGSADIRPIRGRELDFLGR
jgi:hypothetical protein